MDTTNLGIAKQHCQTLIKQLERLDKNEDLYADYEEIMSVKILLEHYEQLQRLNKEKSAELDNKDKQIEQLKQIIKTYNTFKNETLADDVEIVVLLKKDYDRLTKEN